MYAVYLLILTPKRQLKRRRAVTKEYSPGDVVDSVTEVMNDRILGIELATWAIIIIALLSLWETVVRPAVWKAAGILVITYR